jgi:hypothetical protein
MPETIELNEDMTSEDIKSFAESIVEEVQQERQGESKSDAEIVTDVASVEKPSAEEKSSTKTAEVEDLGEKTGSKSKAPKWLSDDVIAEATAYGIDEEDLSDFASREELEKVFRIFDKRALDVGRKAMADGDEGKARNEKGRFVKSEDTKEDDEPSESRKRSDRYEITLSKDLYDDEIVDEFARMRDYYESRMEKLESHFTVSSAKSEEERFDNFVDSLGHAELFGKTGKESEKELQRRTDLHVAVKAQMIGLEQLGRPVEFSDKLVDRVAHMLFAEELSKKRLKQQTQKVFKQNQLRQGGSPIKPQPVSDNPRDEFDRLYKELERS